MADTKISALTELTTPAGEDLLAVVDDPGGTPVSKSLALKRFTSLIDLPVGGSDDYEFNATGSSLPSGYSWVNQGTASYSEANGSGALVLPAGLAVQHRAIVRSLPAGFASVTARLHFILSDSAGLILRQSSDGKEVVFLVAPENATPFLVMQFNSPSSFNATKASYDLNDAGGGGLLMRIVKNSSTDWDFQISRRGAGWATIGDAIDFSAFMTADQVGIIGQPDGTAPGLVEIDWIRFT